MTFTNLAQSQQEANELGANPSSPALDPIALFSGSMVAAGGFSRPLAASLCPFCEKHELEEQEYAGLRVIVCPDAPMRFVVINGRSWSKARNKRAEERLRIMREAIDRG